MWSEQCFREVQLAFPGRLKPREASKQLVKYGGHASLR